MHPQPVVEVERVTHAEGADKDVELARVALVVKEEAAIAVQVVEIPVRDIAKIFEETFEPSVLTFLHDHIDIAVAALECGWKWRVAMHADGRAAEQPNQQLRSGRALQQASRLRLDVGKRASVVDHSGHLNAQAGSPRVAR